MTQYGEEKFTEIFKTITADNGSEFDTLSELKILVEGYNYKTWSTLDFFIVRHKNIIGHKRNRVLKMTTHRNTIL